MVKHSELFLQKLSGISKQSNSAMKLSRAEMLFQVKADLLTEKTLNSTSAGISSDDICNGKEVIVSLTTFGKRLYDTYLPIESVMQGSIKPNRIILWLADDLKNKTLPITLQKQQSRGLQVRYCHDIKSYKKIIPTLKEFPDACIITIDDDAIYKFDLIENMVSAYNNDPNHIYANRMRRITLDGNGKPISYLQWPFCTNDDDASHLNFTTGVGAVLFPPGSLAQEVFNESVFMDLCSTADDIWLNAMALLNDTKRKKVITRHPLGFDFSENGNVQDIGLKNINTNKLSSICMNDKILADVFSRYDLFEKLI